MRKSLVQVGNSLAIIIDKPYCALLRLSRGTSVEVSIAGSSFVATPIHEERPRSPREELLRTLAQLDMHGLTKERFQNLSNDGQTLGVVHGSAALGDPVDPVTIERLKECLDRRENCNETWDATLQAVMARKRAKAA